MYDDYEPQSKRQRRWARTEARGDKLQAYLRKCGDRWGNIEHDGRQWVYTEDDRVDEWSFEIYRVELGKHHKAAFRRLRQWHRAAVYRYMQGSATARELATWKAGDF